MTHLTRRALLCGTMLIPVAACDFVTTTTTNGVTTVTVNVSEATTILSGAAGVASIFIGLPGVGALLTKALGAAAMAALPTIIADINGGVGALATNAAGQQTFTFTTTSAPAFVTALIADAKTLIGDAVAVLPVVGASGVASQVSQYAQGLNTLGNAILNMFSGAVKVGAEPGAMTVKQALALLPQH